MRSCPLVLVLLLVTASCSESGSSAPAVPKRERPLVITTIQPLHFFVSRLAGNLVDCEVVLPHGEHPQHFVPDRATLARLLTADLVIFHGAGLEAWQGKVGLPRSRQSIVCTGWSDELVKIEGSTAVVRLRGACRSCAMANSTLTDFVAERIKLYAPEITEVVTE